VGVFDTPKFKKLHQAWDKKLEKAGLPDIEDGQGRLTHHDDLFQLSRLNGFKSDTYESVRDYYIWVTHSLNWAQFQSRTDEMIWLGHEKGDSSHKIAEDLCMAQTTVSFRIKKIRIYVKEQQPNSAES
jgi:hypothetical protein